MHIMHLKKELRSLMPFTQDVEIHDYNEKILWKRVIFIQVDFSSHKP